MATGWSSTSARRCGLRQTSSNVEADVLVPGARIGVIDEKRAGLLRVRVVAPAANVPYTHAALVDPR